MWDILRQLGTAHGQLDRLYTLKGRLFGEVILGPTSHAEELERYLASAFLDRTPFELLLGPGVVAIASTGSPGVAPVDEPSAITSSCSISTGGSFTRCDGVFLCVSFRLR